MLIMDRVGELRHIAVTDLKHYEKNRKQHSDEQIEMLAKLIKAHGFRDPLIVDQDTMEVIAGNGTLQAVRKLGLETVPCVLQKFDSDEQRYAFSISHNAIQTWDPIDLGQIHLDLPDLQGFDVDLLGIKDFRFEPPPGSEKSQNSQDRNPKMVTCPHCEQSFETKI